MYKPKTGTNAAKFNRDQIEQYLAKHPETTGVEIGKALNLSLPTVYKHLADMREEHLESDYSNAVNI